MSFSIDGKIPGDNSDWPPFDGEVEESSTSSSKKSPNFSELNSTALSLQELKNAPEKIGHAKIEVLIIEAETTPEQVKEALKILSKTRESRKLIGSMIAGLEKERAKNISSCGTQWETERLSAIGEALNDMASAKEARSCLKVIALEAEKLDLNDDWWALILNSLTSEKIVDAFLGNSEASFMEPVFRYYLEKRFQTDTKLTSQQLDEILQCRLISDEDIYLLGPDRLGELQIDPQLSQNALNKVIKACLNAPNAVELFFSVVFSHYREMDPRVKEGWIETLSSELSKAPINNTVTVLKLLKKYFNREDFDSLISKIPSDRLAEIVAADTPSKEMHEIFLPAIAHWLSLLRMQVYTMKMEPPEDYHIIRSLRESHLCYLKEMQREILNVQIKGDLEALKAITLEKIRYELEAPRQVPLRPLAEVEIELNQVPESNVREKRKLQLEQKIILESSPSEKRSRFEEEMKTTLLEASLSGKNHTKVLRDLLRVYIKDQKTALRSISAIVEDRKQAIESNNHERKQKLDLELIQALQKDYRQKEISGFLSSLHRKLFEARNISWECKTGRDELNELAFRAIEDAEKRARNLDPSDDELINQITIVKSEAGIKLRNEILRIKSEFKSPFPGALDSTNALLIEVLQNINHKYPSEDINTILMRSPIETDEVAPVWVIAGSFGQKWLLSSWIDSLENQTMEASDLYHLLKEMQEEYEEWHNRNLYQVHSEPPVGKREIAELEGKDYQEAAEILKITLGNLEKRVSQLDRKLSLPAEPLDSLREKWGGEPHRDVHITNEFLDAILEVKEEFPIIHNLGALSVEIYQSLNRLKDTEKIKIFDIPDFHDFAALEDFEGEVRLSRRTLAPTTGVPILSPTDTSVTSKVIRMMVEKLGFTDPGSLSTLGLSGWGELTAILQKNEEAAQTLLDHPEEFASLFAKNFGSVESIRKSLDLIETDTESEEEDFAISFVEKMTLHYKVSTKDELKELGLSDWSDIKKLLEIYPSFKEKFGDFEKAHKGESAKERHEAFVLFFKETFGDSEKVHALIAD